ncbi:MAG: protein kinase [Blastocatellia bacterium]
MIKQKQPDFKGTERFLIQRCIGSGGFGVVYEAYDQERKAVVALKTLHELTAESLYLFKQEFRLLADINHPNLITLYELMSDQDQCFFTMELVQGVNFLQYVRLYKEELDPNFSETINCITSSINTASQDEQETAITPTPTPKSTTPSDSISQIQTIRLSGEEKTNDDQVEVAISSQPNFKFDPLRLRDALRQLATGIYAIHTAGKLHRDIKPSNILVTEGGRVVILDFGLAMELVSKKQQEHIVGTPAYMSPEQCANTTLTEATDWYSVGVILYESLTGKRPFSGQALDLLVHKQRFEPLPPNKLVKDIPKDLDLLCQQLLKKDPQKRPLGKEILQRLSNNNFSISSLSLSAPQAIPFVGRESYINTIKEAFSTVKEARRTVTVYVYGNSGMGKSSLVRHFLKQLDKTEKDIVVLTGRCYEQESVPYKAFDSLIDDLSQHLKDLSKSELEKLLPDDVLALARLFPVLKQVSAIASHESKVLEIPDSQELRRRAFNALRELLARLAAKNPLILFIDDLQWGDLDSAGLLIELLQPPNPPPFLLLTTYRSEEIKTSPFLTTFLPLREKTEVEIKDLAIKELSKEEAKKLAIALLGKENKELLELAEMIAQESKGNPFFVDELVRFMQLSETSVEQSYTPNFAYLKPVTSTKNKIVTVPIIDNRKFSPSEETSFAKLDQVIYARIISLPENARKLLEVVAVAGQPLERAIAKEAAQLDSQEQTTIALLRANRMIRLKGTKHQEQLEAYHDRIRETVVANLSSEKLKTHHRKLGSLLETTADPERLANHFYKAGNNDKAAKYAFDAAEKAYNALAFDHAARLYQLALKLCKEEDLQHHQLQVKLANSLANAGRNYEAAQNFLAAIKTADELEALELRQRASDQLLRCGYLKESFAELKIITDKVGIKIAETPLQAILSFLVNRVKLWFRGLEFKERPASEVPPEVLLRLDTFRSIASGLSLIDATRGVDLQSRYLLFALRVGEPQRISLALAIEAGYSSSAGGRKAKRTEKLLQLTKELAERINYPYGIAISTYVAGISAGCFGQWKLCIERFAQAEAFLRQNCTGVSAELDTASYWTFTSLYFMGDFNQLFSRMPTVLKDIRERGSLIGETMLRLRTTYIKFLANDEVDNAKTELEESIGRWSQKGFQMQHFWHLFGQVQTLLYEGDAKAAQELLKEKWPKITKSFLLRIQSFYLQILHLQARTILALVAKDPSSSSLLKVASRNAQLIEKENMPWGNAFAKQIYASIAAIKGEKEKAIKLLTETEKNFESVDMLLYATVVRRRRGELLANDQGKQLIETTDNWIKTQQIKKPDAMANMLVPGKWKD